MKKVFVACSLMAACVSAMSQGYVGAVVALSRVDGACGGQDTCDQRGHAVRAYFGTPLSAENQIDFGVGKISAVEVGLIGFGKGRSSGQASYTPDVNNPPVSVPTQRSTTSNALTFAAVARIPVAGDLSGVLRAGAAYVSSTVRYYVNGVENGSETATKLKPYLGLGLEFEAMKGFRIVGSYDWTKFDVSDQKGGLKAFGLGAEIGF